MSTHSFRCASALLAHVVCSLAFAADALESNTGLCRYPDISKDNIVFVYANDLWVVAKEGGTARPVASPPGYEGSPRFSPDGKTIYFVSDRGGSPQIYRVAVGGGAPERVSFSGNYNISPTVSPDGRSLAFVTRLNGSQFRICVMDLASGVVQQISDGSDDESPSFSPNGRLIVYATRAGGRDVLMTSTLDGRIKAKLISTLVDVREPTWGPFGR